MRRPPLPHPPAQWSHFDQGIVNMLKKVGG